MVAGAQGGGAGRGWPRGRLLGGLQHLIPPLQLPSPLAAEPGGSRLGLVRTRHTGLPAARPSPRAPPARQEGPRGLLPEGKVAGDRLVTAGPEVGTQRSGRPAPPSTPTRALRRSLPGTGACGGDYSTTPSGDRGETGPAQGVRPARLNMPWAPCEHGVWVGGSGWDGSLAWTDLRGCRANWWEAPTQALSRGQGGRRLPRAGGEERPEQPRGPGGEGGAATAQGWGWGAG